MYLFHLSINLFHTVRDVNRPTRYQFVLHNIAGDRAVAGVGVGPGQLKRAALLVVHPDILRHLRNLCNNNVDIVQ